MNSHTNKLANSANNNNNFTTPSKPPHSFSASLSSASTLLGSPARRQPSVRRPSPIRLPSRLRAASSPASPLAPFSRATPPSPPRLAPADASVATSALLEHFTMLLRQQEEEIASLKARLAVADQQAREDGEEIERLRRGLDYTVQIFRNLQQDMQR